MTYVCLLRLFPFTSSSSSSSDLQSFDNLALSQSSSSYTSWCLIFFLFLHLINLCVKLWKSSFVFAVLCVSLVLPLTFRASTTVSSSSSSSSSFISSNDSHVIFVVFVFLLRLLLLPFHLDNRALASGWPRRETRSAYNNSLLSKICIDNDKALLS